MTEPPTVPLERPPLAGDDELLRRARDFRDLMQRRRTVRDFDPRPVPREVIEACIAAAGTAPSGAEVKHYYPAESVGIATGLLITALHSAGLASLTHTPSDRSCCSSSGIRRRARGCRPSSASRSRRLRVGADARSSIIQIIQADTGPIRRAVAAAADLHLNQLRQSSGTRPAPVD